MGTVADVRSLEYAQSEPSQRVSWERTPGASVLDPVLQSINQTTDR
jgi:hypothetical protein